MNADNDGQFNVDDIIDLVEGQASIAEIQAQKTASAKGINIGIKLALGSILLLLIYFLAT